MALTLNNFIGFETGGLQEAKSVTGAPVVDNTRVRTGGYSLRLVAGGNDDYFVDPFAPVADAGDKRIVGFAVYFDTFPATSQTFFRAEEAGIQNFSITIFDDGDLSINWAVGAIHLGAVGLSEDDWFYFEIAWQELDAGDFDLWIDGSSAYSTSGKDLNVGGNFDQYRFEVGTGDDEEVVFDDVYCMSGASGTGDFLGPRTEALMFQNTVEDATDQGTTLDQGTWANTGDTPGVDDGTPAGYTGSGALTGYTRCDEGNRDGPMALITGTAKGAKWLHRLRRGSGSGTVHYKRYGAYNGASDQVVDAAVTLAAAWANFFTVTETDAQVPSDTDEYFCNGFAKATGGRDILCADIWAFLLHVAPDPATLDLSDMEFPDQNYYLGPFGT